MTERAPGTTALEALRTWIGRAAKEFTGDADAARLEARLRRESPAVAACDLQHMRQFEQRLAEAVGEDLGEPADALRPRLVAAAAVAALHGEQRQGRRDPRRGPRAGGGA